MSQDRHLEQPQQHLAMDRRERRAFPRGEPPGRRTSMLARQKALREHGQREVPMQAIPPPPLVMVEAPLALGVI